jgi:hypothetical protein
MATLTKASAQWVNRPADESYESLEALHQAAGTAAQRARKAVVPTRDLHPVVMSDGNIALNGSSGINAPLSHWSFGQLARIADAPADYLRQLPAPLAVDCLVQGIRNPQTNHDDNTLVLFDQNGSTRVRALTSTGYARIMNVDVTSRLIRLAEQKPEWQPAPAAMDGKRGLYQGDRDMFAFLVDNGRRVFEQAPGGGLSRGFFVWNSEVGAESFGICTFLYEYVCGNHIVWGAKAVKELRLRHVGKALENSMSGIDAYLKEYEDSSAKTEEDLIFKARQFRIGETKDEVLDKVFGLRVPALSRKVIVGAYEIAENFSDRYGDPRTAWAVANGITQFSQSKQYANQRVELDRAGGKVLDMAF